MISYTPEDRDILIKTVWGEARGEKAIGKMAVAWVILNRTRKPQWPNTIREVCLQPWQFSCWNDNDPNRGRVNNLNTESADPVIAEVRRCVDMVLQDLVLDPTNGADHYYADWIATPNWARGKTPSSVIGRHRFFNLHPVPTSKPEESPMVVIRENIELHKLGFALLKEIQEYLKTLGYYDDTIDGKFGKNTAHAFASWKGDRWLEFPTIIGPGSYRQLKEEAEKNPAIDWANFDSKISKYFTVGEVALNQRERIPTNPEHRKNAILLAQKLDTVREEWGSPIIVTSWYRPPAVNQRVGGAKNSQHLYGLAADIRPASGNIHHFQSWLDARWTFAMGYGASKGFVHCDLRPGRIRWNY
ncbi:cell wall hydrolase [Synechocystis sp. FACHB-383]|uniref:cell wall hydrolase n=1 Tax=Synechocystis sp. FACHB-383 TaxID=2692864 RepID=UPI001688369B|nr:D-Ala-D-Ala carboxypeptidase family metallohydrolase [Synechocystis sp. FACHB-383]MBD2653667.1 cell wall hydrolase [Synechocystis sp. FACHB-383]